MHHEGTLLPQEAWEPVRNGSGSQIGSGWPVVASKKAVLAMKRRRCESPKGDVGRFWTRPS